MTDDNFGSLASSLDAPLIVVTAAAGQQRAGCLVGFHSQSSIEPLRYCVWLSKANHTYRVALHSTHLALHFLTSSDLTLAEWFGTRTGDNIDKFATAHAWTGPGGVPVLESGEHWLVGRRTALVDDGGDHVCIMTEPVAMHAGGPFRPLRLSQAAHIEPGHGNEERPRPLTERAAPEGRAS